MNVNDLIILNFEEVRRRSIKVWKSIPEEMLNWKPDEEALTCAEMIRHVLESEFFYHQMLIKRESKSLSDVLNPFHEKRFVSVNDELSFAEPYRKEFLKFIESINENEIEHIKIDRSEVGYIRTMGDMLLRISYHESVHTGQLLDYMRTMGMERPMIWD